MHAPQRGPEPFSQGSRVWAGVHDFFFLIAFTWTKRQLDLLPSSWQNLPWSCPCPQDEMKTQDLTQNSDLLGHPPCHQSYHPPLVTQPRAPAPQTLHLIPETRFLLFRFATHCSFLTLHLANSCLSFRTCGLSVTICKSFSSPARVSYSLKLSWQSTIVLSLFLHVHSAH